VEITVDATSRDQWRTGSISRLDQRDFSTEKRFRRSGGNGALPKREDQCMRTRIRIQPYVPRELASRLRAYAAAKGVPDGAVVHAALDQYLDRDRNDRELLMRRLDRNTVGISEVRRDIAIVAEALGTFVHAWFAVTPVTSGPRDAATSRREARVACEQLIQRVAHSFMSPDGFMVRVLAERGTTEADERRQRTP
jgi:hypothetical protein